MSRIQELLAGNITTINFPALLRSYPWIAHRNMKCVLSPDSDGLLCGLFMSQYFGWKIVGYYDGKVLLLKEGVSTSDEDCIFLDMEIYRRHVKSVGHHMVLLNKRHVPSSWDNFDQCLQPNNIRNYDGTRDFRLKYPLATIHLLLAIAGSFRDIEIPRTAIAPLFFVDGTFNVLYSYPENVLNWLNYLGIENQSSPLRKVFMHDHFTVYEQIKVMDEFFRRRDELNRRGERGDKFAISDRNGQPKDIESQGRGLVRVIETKKSKVEGFINLLAQTTRWEYNPQHWFFDELRVYRFRKDSFKARGWTISNRDFEQFMSLNPLSWAMTSGQDIEFTIETPDALP